MFTLPSPVSAWIAQFKLYLLLALAVVLVASGSYLTYRLMKADNIRLENERDAARQNATNFESQRNKLQENFDASEEQSRQRGIRIAKLERENLGLRADRANQKAKDPIAKSWYESPIPVSVRELRRHGAGCPLNLQLPCPNSEPATDSGAVDDGRDKRSTNRGNGSLAFRASILQFRQGGAFAMGGEGAIKEVAKVKVLKLTKEK